MQKVKADRTGNFTVINNYHLHDKNISTSAKTLMTLLLSLPEDWKLSVKGIAKILNESEYAIRRMMKELETGGYLKKEQRKDKNGRYRETEFTVYEVPQQEAPFACLRRRIRRTQIFSIRLWIRTAPPLWAVRVMKAVRIRLPRRIWDHSPTQYPQPRKVPYLLNRYRLSKFNKRTTRIWITHIWVNRLWNHRQRRF